MKETAHICIMELIQLGHSKYSVSGNIPQLRLFFSTTTDPENHILPKGVSSNLLLQIIRRNTEREKPSGSKGLITWHVWTKGNCFRKS